MLLSERHFCGLFAWSISPRSVSILMDLCVFNIFLLKLVIAIALSDVEPMYDVGASVGSTVIVGGFRLFSHLFETD